MMMTFIIQRGEGQGNTKKERKATKSRGRGLEEGARRALMRQDGEEDVVRDCLGRLWVQRATACHSLSAFG